MTLQRTLERIVRDVLTARGFRATRLQVDRTDIGWRVTGDLADRRIVVEVPDNPAAMRAAIEHWADTIDR